MSEKSLEELNHHARKHLAGLSPTLIEAYVRFSRERDLAALDEIVLGVLEYHLPPDQRRSLAAELETASLVADLGVDSLVMVESVFMLEGLLGVTLAEKEIAHIVSLGELRLFLRQKVTAA